MVKLPKIFLIQLRSLLKIGTFGFDWNVKHIFLFSFSKTLLTFANQSWWKNENDQKWDIGICPNDTLVDFHKLQVVVQGWVDLENLIKFMDENETILLSRYVAAFEKGSQRLKC